MADLRRAIDERLRVTGGAPVEVARIVNRLLDGQSQNVGRVTLATGTTSTVVRSAIFRPSTVLVLVPLSEDAAAVTWWMEPVTEKQAVTIGHDSPGSDVALAWVAVG